MGFAAGTPSVRLAGSACRRPPDRRRIRRPAWWMARSYSWATPHRRRPAAAATPAAVASRSAFPQVLQAVPRQHFTGLTRVGLEKLANLGQNPYDGICHTFIDRRMRLSRRSLLVLVL